MKKVLIAGAALLLAGGIGIPVAANADEPGVKITGDARVRYIFQNNVDFGQPNRAGRTQDARTGMDSRVRINITGTAAGGAYAKTRLRLSEGWAEDYDRDNGGRADYDAGDRAVWVDMAYLGIPFNEYVTLETGKYRSTYGPMTKSSSFNLLYDDVSSAGAKLLITAGGWEITPFIEWMSEAQYKSRTERNPAIDRDEDNDEMRYGANFRYTFNENWAAGALLGFQTDDRAEDTDWKQNDGFFASLYVNGKVDNFAITAELAFTESDINGFNNWRDDAYPGAIDSNGQPIRDSIGSKDNGFGGYIFPNYTINNLNIGLNLGFTSNGFIPDYNFGFYLMGSEEPTRIIGVGEGGDWLWAGLVVNYKASDKLRLTGNLVYADVDAWDPANIGPNGDGPRSTYADAGLESAWEISGRLQYTISKGLVFSWYAGYLQPDFEFIEDDGYFASYAKFDLSF